MMPETESVGTGFHFCERDFLPIRSIIIEPRHEKRTNKIANLRFIRGCWNLFEHGRHPITAPKTHFMLSLMVVLLMLPTISEASTSIKDNLEALKTYKIILSLQYGLDKEKITKINWIL
ncbi:hypothetical protein EGR_02107 [Echinococcus granulosus]|uniref:Uncharacterized protein n=1 Tax=Echinococcus granulosus TaxID=6210 RepID=W6UP50_ECHGR|nr:hypothetical protein EGR_02107 [Echinococcus granulosus]EUB63013.1 hypothetical protein EGR_02107 [Echinococcus granulosus]